EHGGAVLTTTIATYVHATLLPRPVHNARICSLDYDIVADYNLAEPLMDQNTQLQLFDAVLRRFEPQQGFDLFIESDAPVGSGQQRGVNVGGDGGGEHRSPVLIGEEGQVGASAREAHPIGRPPAQGRRACHLFTHPALSSSSAT
ncbi:MAG: hypothetical protein J7M38_05930, partial [Armatimonadetes bacterium]|nr:hypothetical protein [Armatimonadota bacterium]